MNEIFRMITNGLEYKIQERVERRFFWWKWEKWVTLTGINGLSVFQHRRDAEREYKLLKDREAKRQEWIDIYLYDKRTSHEG